MAMMFVSNNTMDMVETNFVDKQDYTRHVALMSIRMEEVEDYIRIEKKNARRRLWKQRTRKVGSRTGKK